MRKGARAVLSSASCQEIRVPRISWNFLALANFMRLSEKKQIRVFSSRHRSVGAPYLARCSRDVGDHSVPPAGFRPAGKEHKGSRIPHLANNERDMGHPLVCGREKSPNNARFILPRVGEAGGQLHGKAHTRARPALRGRKSESPGFPVEFVGFGEIHAPFFAERRNDSLPDSDGRRVAELTPPAKEITYVTKVG